jgi:hypothetical protein
MALFAFGSQPEFDVRPDFARCWQSLPPDWREGKGDARREWVKACPRPNAAFEQRCIAAVQAQSQTEKWKLGYRTTPAKWIRGERWEDWVPQQPKPSGYQPKQFDAGGPSVRDLELIAEYERNRQRGPS